MAMVAKCEETIYVLDQPYSLSTNCFQDTVFPKGYEHLKRFSLSPFPTFTYEVEEFRIEKTIYLRRGQNTVVLRYRLISGEEELVRIEIKPLINCRPIGERRKSKSGFEGELVTAKGQVCFKSPGAIPPLYFAHQAAIVDKSGEWFGKIVYPRDQELAEPAGEYLYCPCNFIYSFMARDEFMLAISTQPVRLPESTSEWLNQEKEEAVKILGSFADAGEPIQRLAVQSEHHIVRRGSDVNSIIRGVHGGTDSAWAAMIALPGYFLVPGKYDEAKQTLIMYASVINRGFLPSAFREEDGEPVYQSIDAALWFAEAVFLYGQVTEDYEMLEKKMYPALRRIIKYYERGTHYGVHVDEDGLVEQKDPSVALTWMNATVRGEPVTPRWGKAVEVNALWYNMLRVTETLAIKFRDSKSAKSLDRLALKVYENFNKQFWNEKRGFLHDTIQGSRKDASVRPNQIFSMSVSFPVLQKKYWPLVLQTVTQELFTPFGLRTLSKRSKAYRPRCRGDRASRAQAAHQGTVWAWLMGPYMRAYLLVYGNSKAVKTKLLRLFEPLFNHLSHYGLNSISSTFDGNAPHTARGLIADAVAAAEVIRSYDELASEGPRREVLQKFELK